MKNNTIVTTADNKYTWGVFLLIASMRKNGMDEPVIIYAKNFAEHSKKVVSQFPDVTIVDVGDVKRSLTCCKPDAMLLADTDYVTWVDGDAFFENNCSGVLTPRNESDIMIRKRLETEALAAKLSVRKSDGKVSIADFMLDVWKTDVGELDTPRLNTCCSACIISLSKKYKFFLQRWKDFMEEYLHTGDVGVVDHRNPAYFQTDESAINALLCFMRDAPNVQKDFFLNRKNTLFRHFVGKPKPWVGWPKSSLRDVDAYLDVVDYVLDLKLDLPTPLPFSLNRKNKKYFGIMSKFARIQNFLNR